MSRRAAAPGGTAWSARGGGTRSGPARHPAPVGAAAPWLARDAPEVVTSDGLKFRPASESLGGPPTYGCLAPCVQLLVTALRLPPGARGGPRADPAPKCRAKDGVSSTTPRRARLAGKHPGTGLGSHGTGAAVARSGLGRLASACRDGRGCLAKRRPGRDAGRRWNQRHQRHRHRFTRAQRGQSADAGLGGQRPGSQAQDHRRRICRGLQARGGQADG